MWQAFVKMIDGGGIDLRKLEKMDTDEGMRWLVDQMLQGRRLKGGGAGARPASTAGDGRVRYSRKEMNALAKSKVGEWVEGTSADGIRNAVEKRIQEGMPEGEYRFKNAEDRSRLVRGAVKFYKRFAQKTVMLSDGRCVYFVPDARARERGLTNEEAWAEYAIHAVTSSGKPLEGKGYNERLYNATKAQNIWRIENILKAERCEAIIEDDPQRDSIVFFGRGVKGDVVRIVTRLDERGNVYADLAEVTMLSGGKMKKLPPRKPLTEVVETVVNRRQRGGLLTADAESISKTEGGAQGEIRPQSDYGNLRFSRGAGDERRRRAKDALEMLLPGVRMRVAEGTAERTEAGFEAGAQVWMEREGKVTPASETEPVSLDLSEAVQLYKDITGSAKGPKVDPAIFGTVDASDREALKEGQRKEGHFRNEDPAWTMGRTSQEIANERSLSEHLLENSLRGLADDRAKGRLSGGQRNAVNAVIHEIAKAVVKMPGREGDGATTKAMRSLGRGIEKMLWKGGTLMPEAAEAVRWWRGGDVRPQDTAAELYGMFLAAPAELEARAPNVFGAIRDSLARNDALLAAYNRLRVARAAGGAHEQVMRKIRENWTVEAQREVAELEKELDRPVGGKFFNWTQACVLNLGSNEGPAVRLVDRAVARRLKELKRAMRKGVIGKAEYEIVRKEVQAELDGIRTAVLVKQRGGARDRFYASDVVTKVVEAVEGLEGGDALDELQQYMRMRFIANGGQGRKMEGGVDQRQAQKLLDAQKERLGAEGWAKVEAAARRFQALREKHVLDDEFVREAFGEELTGYWRANVTYVRSERTMSAEELAAYKAARERWAKEHPGEADVLTEIEAMLDLHWSKGAGGDGTAFLKPLKGSFRMSKEPIAATLENDLRILQFARRNHWALALADAAKELGLDGFREMRDQGQRLPQGNRYGMVSFLRDGERRVLVMPKVVARGFDAAATEIGGLVKANRMISAVLTQYSPRFANRNIFRNRAANENLVPWMNEGRVVQAARLAGAGPVARLAEYILERGVVRLKKGSAAERIAQKAIGALWGETTNLYNVAEATRLAKLLVDPRGIDAIAREADRLVTEKGDTAAAQQLLEDCEKVRELARHPIFAGHWEKALGETESGRGELAAVLKGFNITRRRWKDLDGLQKVGRAMEETKDAVKRFNDFEEARVKIIALLAAERAKMNAEAKGGEFKYNREQQDYIVATMSGSPRYENRGRWMNVLEATQLGPFANVGLKGALRVVESIRIDPGAFFRKAAIRYTGRVVQSTLWTGGGYAVLAALARRLFKDDEKAQKAIDGFENFGKRMAKAYSCVSDYRLRNYDVIPIGLYGTDSTFGINLPRGDEDRFINPLADMTVKAICSSDMGKELGLSDPIDSGYGWFDAAQNMVMNTGLLPDITRGSMVWNIGKDVLWAWMQNPYNSFTQRTMYSQKDFDERWERPGRFFMATMKQAWNDIGAQIILPATTWDEDEGQVVNEGRWVMGMDGPEEAAKMPVGGKTIFRALHYLPLASAMLSGVFFMNCEGNKRVARRLAKMQEEEKEVMNRIAMKCIEKMRVEGRTDADYAQFLDEAVKSRGWGAEERNIIEQTITKKLNKLAKETGNEKTPILELMSKKSMPESTYNRFKKALEGWGWEIE